MRRDGMMPGMVFLVALGVYALTMAPSLTWAHWGADGGDFIAAAATGRMPHPPGFPLYMTLARAFVRLPLRNPAWRLNLLSAVMAAGTVMLTARLLQRQEKSPWIVLAATLSLAFAPLFWSQALITEVYTTAAFFVTLGMLNGEWMTADKPATIENRRSAIRHPGLAGLIWGLGMAVHPTVVLLAPLAFVSLWGTEKRFHRRRLAYRFICYILGIGLGLAFYLLLPLWGPWPQPWGDLRTFAGWWDVVRARLYWGYAFGLPLRDWPARGLAYVSLLARQFTPLGGASVLLGAWLNWRIRRRQTWGWLATAALFSLFAIGYNTADSLTYVLPLLPLAVPLLARGLHWLVAQGIPAWATVALPLLLLVSNWHTVDVSRDREAVNWLTQVLAETPPDAVLLTQSDAHTFSLWYAQEAAGLRPDVLVIDRDLWWQESYRQFLFRQVGYEAATPETMAPARPLCRAVKEGVTCP